MLNFTKTTPRTTVGILLSSVSAIALTVACTNPSGPGNGGNFIDSEILHPTVDAQASMDSKLDDQDAGLNTDKPPTTIVQTITPKRFVGFPDQIVGWTATYFQPWEFASKGNGQINVDARLVEQIDVVRKELGLPISITSAYRDPAHNAHVDGAKNSQHVHGTAIDINISAYDAATRYRLLLLLVKHGFTSFGSYASSPSMLHADIRERAAKWHHGAGTHPQWFSRALDDAGWKRGATAAEMMPKITAQATAPQKMIEVVENTDVTRSVTLNASKSFDGPIKLEGLYEVTDPNGWGLGANIAYETETDDLTIGLTAKYDKDDVSADIQAAYNGRDIAFDVSVTHDF